MEDPETFWSEQEGRHLVWFGPWELPLILRDEEVTEIIVRKFKNVVPGLLNDKEVIDIITQKGVKVLLQRKELSGGLVAGLLQKIKGLLRGLLGGNDE